MATCISVARSRSTWGSAGRRAAAIFARWASALTDTRKLYCVDGSSGCRVKAGTGTKSASSNVSLKATSDPRSRESTLGAGGGAGRRAVGAGEPPRKGGKAGARRNGQGEQGQRTRSRDGNPGYPRRQQTEIGWSAWCRGQDRGVGSR